jgi:hypothetical protein
MKMVSRKFRIMQMDQNQNQNAKKSEENVASFFE